MEGSRYSMAVFVALMVASALAPSSPPPSFDGVPAPAGGPMDCGGVRYATVPGTEVVRNGGFESDFVGWYSRAVLPAIATSPVRSGSKSAGVVANASHPIHGDQDVSSVPGTYVFSHSFYVSGWGPGGVFATGLMRNWVGSSADMVSRVLWTPPRLLWNVWLRTAGGGVTNTLPYNLSTGAWHDVGILVNSARGTQCLYIDGAFVSTAAVDPADVFAPDVLIFGDISQDGDAGVAYYDDVSILAAAPTNRPPAARAGGPYAGQEGAPIRLDASGSSDPDNDPLRYRWDFESDGAWDTNWSSSPLATHTWGDDWSGRARVEVTDGTFTANATANVTVANVAPTLALTIAPGGSEGDTLVFRADVADPGSDDLLVAWNGSCAGWSPPTTYANDPAAYPDPHPSPDVHPRSVRDSQSLVCGDNGVYGWSVDVTDDDGGTASARGTFSVGNLPPVLTVSPPTRAGVDEGSRVGLSASATDPGSDDLAFDWSWTYGPTESHVHYNDGVSPDPPGSPNGTFPFTASDTSSFVYGHEGTFPVTLTVTDDDGGFLTFTTEVEVRNVAPTVVAVRDVTIDEGSPANVSFTFRDPGFDMPTAGLHETFTAAVDWGYPAWPPEAVAVQATPGGPGVPARGTVDLTRAYGDDGAFTVTLTVCDDGGGCGSGSLRVTVRNVPPDILDVRVFAAVTAILRVAGEKWHDVRMDLVWNDNVMGSTRVVRTPGSPDRQEGAVDGAIELLGRFAIVVTYTPEDDPVNGQGNGANPVWVILTFPGGSEEVRLHHTFNARHEETWAWTISDLRPYLLGRTITFQATAHDVGSDDLTFEWSFGDGSPAVSTVHYNDGVGPDPHPSPEVNPITAADGRDHVYATAGTFTVTLTVTDDDGGTATFPLLLGIG